MKTLCIATSTRADWGILRPLAEALRDSGRVRLQILATNMHLMDTYGHTIDEILAAGFEVDARVPMPDAGDSPEKRAEAMGVCLGGTAAALGRLKPYALLLLGDRYEMMAVASAAAVMGIPIIHLHGGEISEGAIDDSLRHAITKLSTLHLTATDEYRRRVIQLGEHPDRVVNTGALGVWNLMNQPRISRAELCDSLGLDASVPFAVVTFHPATLDRVAPAERCRAMVEALDRFPQLNIIATYPNNDAGNEVIIEVLKQWAARSAGRVALVKTLGMHRYLSAISMAAVVVGNSSSAIIEVPAAGTPAVNIGIRQRGRLHSPLVIDCGDSADMIEEAVNKALNPTFVEDARRSPNPYCKENTLELAVETVLKFMDTLPVEPKKFYDL